VLIFLLLDGPPAFTFEQGSEGEKGQGGGAAEPWLAAALQWTEVRLVMDNSSDGLNDCDAE
jgi:hypothetical protein